MASLGKRARGALQEISPPPLRRKQLRRDSPAPTTKNPNHFRVFSWNVNGIGPLIQKPITSFFDPRSASSSPLREFLKRHDWPEVLCLQEVKINPDDEDTKWAVQRAANGNGVADEGPAYSVHFCVPRDKYNAKGFGGKVYGVANILRDDVATQTTREVPWDLEGRVLITETESKLAIINGYWVNGTDNKYKDPETGEVVGTRHDHKRYFHKHMLGTTLHLEKEGFHVILAGDMNIARGPLDGHPNLRMGQSHIQHRKDFNQKFFISEEGMKGIDTFRHLHGEKKKYTYHGRGHEWGASCDRVDLIIVSKSVVENDGALVQADILDNPFERGHSDHVPLYITLDTQKLAS